MMSKKNSPLRPYGRRRSTKEKRRDAAVRDRLKAEKRDWRRNKEIEEKVAQIRRERSGVCDESGRLTPDGKAYIRYFRDATRIMAQHSNQDMDYLVSLGRLLAQFKSKTQWETKHHWSRRFEQDIGLKPSKANNLLRVWATFGDDLDHLRYFSRRKLISISRAKDLHFRIDHKELVARMRSLKPDEIKKLTPEQLIARLKGEEIQQVTKSAKLAPPTVISLAPNCRIILPPDFRSLIVDWGFPDQEFQWHVGEELKHRMARLLRGREELLAIHRKKS